MMIQEKQTFGGWSDQKKWEEFWQNLTAIEPAKNV
jgi:hypothetical protein